MWPRALVVLTTVAVLCGAPSSASAAGPNTLSAPVASPASGTTEIIFSFSATYTGGFPVRSVSVDVAGRGLRMILVDGSLSNGTWTVATLLPTGSWTPTFQAVASRGKNPSITGPAVTVAPLTTRPPPSAPPASTDPGSPARSAQPAAGAAEGGGSHGSPAAPAATEQPAATGGGSSDPAAAPMASAAGAVESVDPDPSDAPAGSDTPRRSAGVAGAAATPAWAPREAKATPTDDATSIPTEDASGSVEIAVGLGGAAALALFAWLLVLAGRRRRTAPGASPVANRIRGPAGTADEQVTATLYRRTLRRSKIRLDEDPIIASMGVEAADAETRGRAARRSTRRSPPT